MSTAKTLFTAEEFDNYPFEEDKRYELDEGELIEMTRPAYIHNKILGNMFAELRAYCRKTKCGEALVSENLYALSPSTRRSPDVAVILGDRRAELEKAKVIPIVPDIAVEILSPSETQRMLLRKLNQYFEAGVKEVWVIHPESREAEIWSGPKLPVREFGAADPITTPLLPGFSITIDELFV